MKRSNRIYMYAYQLVFFIFFIVYLPKLLIDLWKKKNCRLFWLRLFPKAVEFPPHFLDDKQIIWIHAVSVGEAIAVAPLIDKLQLYHRNSVIITSHATQAGLETAKKCMPTAFAHIYMPFDFIFSLRRMMRLIPNIYLLIHSEGDLWPAFIGEAKKRGARIVVSNAKLSRRSFDRYRLLPSLSRWLFGMVDLFCLQTDEYKRRCISLGVSLDKLIVTGNMKADVNVKLMRPEEKDDFMRRVQVSSEDKLIVLGSTHYPEEKMILSELVHIENMGIKIAVVPRHSHRFSEVFYLLSSTYPTKKVVLFSALQKDNINSWDILVVDTMGVLPSLYQIAFLSVVCGSFVSHIGGHNILEPAAAGSPVLVGPYMHSQQWLYDSAVHYHAIIRHKTVQHLMKSILRLSTHKHVRDQMAEKALRWSQESRGATKKTVNAILDLP